MLNCYLMNDGYIHKEGIVYLNQYHVINPLDDTYTKKSLSERWQILSSGFSIQRDIFSAWLIKNVKDDLQEVDRQKCLDSFEKFQGLYQIEENRLSQCSGLISSMGF